MHFSLIIVVAGLKAAQAVIIPFLIALLLAILGAPAVFWLTQHRLPTVISVLLVVLVMLAVFSAFGAVIGGSVNGFKNAIPRYHERLDRLGDSVEAWFTERGVELGEIDTGDMLGPGALMDLLGRGLSALLSTLSNTVVVMLILIFMLLEATGLPVKMRAALGATDADLGRVSNAAMDSDTTLRITVTTIIAAWFNPAFATGAWHEWEGWLVLTATFILSGLGFRLLMDAKQRPDRSSQEAVA